MKKFYIDVLKTYIQPKGTVIIASLDEGKEVENIIFDIQGDSEPLLKVYYEEPTLNNIIGLATQITDESNNTYSIDVIIDLINNNRYTAKAIKKIANNKFQVLLEEIVEEVFE